MKNSTSLYPNHLICFSHLRWDFVFQRPQHILSRFAKDVSVYYFEEPIFDASKNESTLALIKKTPFLTIAFPHLPQGLQNEEVQNILAALLEKLLRDTEMSDCAFWYYTPMALSFTEKFKPRIVIYDCMDELSAFDFAPPELINMEKKLLSMADLVFTGGHSLYEAKKNQHENIYPFPSSIEKEHFSKARVILTEPEDQARIKGQKMGFYGVIDERFDIELIREIAEAKPDWQIILLGPVVKIDPQTLPKNENIHYLGQKKYEELPGYLSGWDVALIPFKLNDATRYISPTKTPEYLAAGVRVVSTPIRDVVQPYGIKKLVDIGTNSIDFITFIEGALIAQDNKRWLGEVDLFLKHNSWDNTYALMQQHIAGVLETPESISIAS